MSSKYTTATPVVGRYINQLEEFFCEPEETIRIFKHQANKTKPFGAQELNLKKKPSPLESLKLESVSGLKLLHLKKVPPMQLDLNPSVDSTPRDIS